MAPPQKRGFHLPVLVDLLGLPLTPGSSQSGEQILTFGAVLLQHLFRRVASFKGDLVRQSRAKHLENSASIAELSLDLVRVRHGALVPGQGKTLPWMTGIGA